MGRRQTDVFQRCKTTHHHAAAAARAALAVLRAATLAVMLTRAVVHLVSIGAMRVGLMVMTILVFAHQGMAVMRLRGPRGKFSTAMGAAAERMKTRARRGQDKAGHSQNGQDPSHGKTLSEVQESHTEK